MALGAVGSIMGCAVAGQAAIGAMLDTDSGFGKMSPFKTDHNLIL
jgi:V/A-type H+-transporting ATPase subunit K